MYNIKQIKTEHRDLIQDIAYDFFGKRVATASLDQNVKIWNINDKNEWVLKEELKVMPGLHKVAWAHPEFGQLIAVAHDRFVWLYEELSSSSKNNQVGWTKCSPAFTDARAPITDIKFAPKHLGLQLAVCASNGEIRIYECNDILNTSAWQIAHQEVKSNMGSCSSCSWSTCFSLPVLLALGCDDRTSANKLTIFEYNESTRTYSRIEIPDNLVREPIRSLAFAPSVGKLYHTLAIASNSLIILTIKPMKEAHKYHITALPIDTEVSAWRVCWNTVGSILASAGDDRRVRLWKSNYLGTWKSFAEITGDSGAKMMDNNFSEMEVLSREKSQPNFGNVNRPYMFMSSLGDAGNGNGDFVSPYLDMHEPNFGSSNTKFVKSGPLSSGNEYVLH